MNKRAFLINSAVGALIICMQAPIYAGGFGNLFKGIAKSLGNQSAKEAERAAVIAVEKAGAQEASKAAVVASRSAKASGLLRDLSVTALTSFVADEALAALKKAPEDSVVRWTIAYYVMLTKSDPDAAMGMWIDPKEAHFRHLAAGQSSYFIHEVKESASPFDGCKRVYVDVTSQNRNEMARRDHVFIDWFYTQNGYRVLKFSSV